MADRPYSRVYYVDLKRDYPSVWRDDAQLSTYLRLLCVAEAMWPAVPEVPRSIRKIVLTKLIAASLVVRVDSFGYRVKGLDAERIARSNAGRNAARSRWGNAPALPAAMPGGMPNRAEPNRAEPPRGRARGTDPILTDEREWTPEQEKAAYIVAMEKRTGVKA